MLKFIENSLIKTNLWVSVCFAGFVAFFQMGLYELNWEVIGIAFFGTLSIYNFTRIGTSISMMTSHKNLSSHFVLTIVGLFGAFICLIARGFEFGIFIYLASLGLLSFLYSLPFTNFGLRAVPVLKLFLIALVWTGSSVGLLLVVHHDIFRFEKLLFSIFFFVVGITIPFDIRDKLTDERELKTVPQIIGVNRAKVIALICLILSGFLFYFEFHQWNIFVVSWIITVLISTYFVLLSHEKRSGFYYSFWVESCSLVPLLIYILNL